MGLVMVCEFVKGWWAFTAFHLFSLFAILYADGSFYELHAADKGQPTMEWPIRLKIALGSAKGLAYLHEDCTSLLSFVHL